jgi:hypothetical protein
MATANSNLAFGISVNASPGVGWFIFEISGRHDAAQTLHQATRGLI